MDDVVVAVLPWIDEHVRVVAAPCERTWSALVRTLPRAFGGAGAARFARLIRCDPTAVDPTFPAPGGTLVGFRVARADPPRKLALVGRHRFSTYALTFRLDAAENGRATLLAAETRAAFPGAAGAAYRAAVIGTRAHVVVVRRLLRTVARQAERPA